VKPSTSSVYRIEAPKGLHLDRRQFLELYRYLTLNRRLEERLSNLYRQNQIVGGLYSSLGQEATSVGSAYALEDGDFLAPMIRNLGSYLVRGVSAKDWVAQYTARACSPTMGKDGTAHFGSIEQGLIGCISMLGSLIPVMAGVALVMKMKKQKNVALTYIGDGGTSTTDFHEGVNFAAVQRVPFILIMEYNYYAYSTPASLQFPTKDLIEKAPSYGVYGEIMDGNNVLAVYDATRRARQRCVEGGGPVLLEAKTFRRKGHAEHDPAEYVPKKLREEWEAKDPLDAYTRFVIDEQLATKSDLDDIDESIRREIDVAVQEVLDSPFPDKSVALQDVYHSDKQNGGPR
jgi:pyruvate dehydrogenase E1 component alpha subunit/2-oxoisovalerate dehydrogenase E1 component alpha subunit